MTPTHEVTLRLRFRERQPPSGPPDTAAFVRPPPAPGRTPARPATSIGVRPGRRPLEPGSSLVIFFQYSTHGIPPIARGEARGLPDLASWSIRPTAFGYLAHVPAPGGAAAGGASAGGALARGASWRHASRRPGSWRPASSPSRAAWVVAACLPLLPLRAEAAPAEQSPTIQRPQDGPQVPTLPSDSESPAAEDPEPDPDAATPPEPEGDPADESSGLLDPMDDSPWSVGPRAESPDSGPAVDLAILDAAWEGVDGFEVDLELKGGKTMQGRVGAVQRDTFTLIQAETGAVLVLPKSGVVSLRVHMPRPLPSRNGSGLLIGGSILTAVSVPVFITGLTFLGVCPSCISLNLPMLFIGGGGLAGGIPMLARGSRYRREYREALQERSVTPVASRTRHGWTGGLRFRF